MIERTFTIKNKTGLHARPASLFVRKAGSFKCSVKIKKDSQVIDAKSIISLLSLGAGNGSTVTIITDGEDEEQAMDELIDLLEGFDD